LLYPGHSAAGLAASLQSFRLETARPV